MRALVFKHLMSIRRMLLGTGIGKIPGTIKVYSFLFKKLKPRGIGKLVANEREFFIDLDDVGMVPQLLEDGVYEKSETELVKKIVTEGMTVVNVGANFGYYVALHSTLVGSTGKVFAFEPEPSNFALLERNVVHNNLQNTIIVNQALGSRIGNIKLYIDSKNIGNPSLIKKNVPNLKNFIEVEMTTLDAYIGDLFNGRVDLIHMDVQGAEGQVIEGARKIISHYKPILLMEFWPYGLVNAETDPGKFLEYLITLDYKIKLIQVDGRLQTVTAEEVIKDCASRKNGKGFANLLLTQ